MPASPRQRIAQIDKQIDTLWLSPKFTPDAERDLFRQRGIIQIERDEADRRAARAAYKPLRLRMCPTCRCHTLAA